MWISESKPKTKKQKSSKVNTLYEKGYIMQIGKEAHEKALSDYIENCENKIIDLKAKSPDAIEVFIKNGEIIVRAVEVLPARWQKHKKIWKKNFTYKQKEYSYRMFDEVKIITYKALYTKPKEA